MVPINTSQNQLWGIQMIFTGKIQLADGTFIQFFENGEMMRIAKGQNTRVTLPEAMMYIKNNASYSHASKTFQLDGKFVTFAAFQKELDAVEIEQNLVEMRDYREQYTEHTPLHLDPSLEVKESDEAEVSDIKPVVPEQDDEEAEAVVVNIEDTGNWWE